MTPLEFSFSHLPMPLSTSSHLAKYLVPLAPRWRCHSVFIDCCYTLTITTTIMSGLGNPAPLGLFAFGMTTAMLMFVETGWAEPEFEQMVSAYAVFLGGLLQIIVAILEICKGSSFSFCVFGSYGAFWLGWALVVLQNESLASEFGEINYSTGKTLWLIEWGVLTSCFFVITLRKNNCLICVFALLGTTFFLLAAATASGNAAAKKTAGYFGFLTACGAWYTGVAELVNEEWGRHVLPGLKPRLSPERFEITASQITKRRTIYDKKSNTLFLQFRSLQIKSQKDVHAIKEGVEKAILESSAPDNKVHVVVDYEDVLIDEAIAQEYWDMVADLERTYYLSARRFHVSSFGTRPNNDNSNMRRTVSATLLNASSSQYAYPKGTKVTKVGSGEMPC
jgi:succinate-acetate transporter protein